MAEICSLRDAVADLIRDGDSIALEGFTHLIPFAAGHELIRQGKRDLAVSRLTPDLIYDQLIGVGAVRSISFSWGGNPGVGSLHRLREAIESGYPRPIEVDEHSHAGMAARYAAGAAGLPFGVLRGYEGTDLPARSRTIAQIDSPFTEESLAAVAALQPDVTVIHAQQADRHGNVAMWGITGVQKEAVMAAKASIVTVEQMVDDLDPPSVNPVVLPSWMLSAVAVVPNGCHPSYAMGFSTRDNSFYIAWDEISRDRDRFAAWVDEYIMSTPDHAAYLAKVTGL